MKKIDSIGLIKSFILMLLSIIFYRFVKKGYAINYVHDRTIPYILISAFIMAIMSLVILTDFSKSIRVRKKKTGFLVYLIPIILFSAILINFNDKNTLINEFTDEINMNNSNEILAVDDEKLDYFTNSLNRENDYIDGQFITVIGFIKNKTDNNNFYIAREVMTCCTADLSILQVKCKSNTDINLSEGSWVKAEGIVRRNKNGNMIFIDKINEINKPKHQYIHYDHIN